MCRVACRSREIRNIHLIAESILEKCVQKTRLCKHEDNHLERFRCCSGGRGQKEKGEREVGACQTKEKEGVNSSTHVRDGSVDSTRDLGSREVFSVTGCS